VFGFAGRMLIKNSASGIDVVVYASLALGLLQLNFGM